MVQHKGTKLSNLYIFGQLGHVPVMNNNKSKHRDRGKLVRYLKREDPKHVWLEETDGSMWRFRANGFHPYLMSRDPNEAFTGTLRYPSFAEKPGEEH